MNIRPFRLSQVSMGDFVLAGYSVAGEESVIVAPELDCVFDIGRCPREALTVNHVLLSHGHADHVAGITYYWMGDQLGGKPDGAVADYDKLRISPAFQQAISELLTLADEKPTAIMCAEGNHRRCHRYKLITPALLDRDVHVVHIQPDSTVVDEEKEPRQLALF